MRLHIHHTTRYRYNDPAAYSIQHLLNLDSFTGVIADIVHRLDNGGVMQ